MSDKALHEHGKIAQMLQESGIEAREYERILLARSLTGGEDVINSEMMEHQAMIIAIMDAITDPLHPDGTIDHDLAYDCPVIRTFNREFKMNMISNKRKGRMEIVKVMRGEEDESSFTGRIKDAIMGAD